MIKVYHSPRTRSVRVIWLLEELGIPHSVQEMPFTQESLRSPDYLKVNPIGKIPAIEDGDVTIFESGAIVEWLLEKYGNGRLAPAPGTAARATYLQWLHFAEATATPPLGDIARHMMFLPAAERIPAVVGEARGRAAAVARVLESALSGKLFLLGEEFSAADVMMGYSLLLMKWFGIVGTEQPNVSAYLERLEQRPGLQKALA